jgi:hypothetical protein
MALTVPLPGTGPYEATFGLRFFEASDDRPLAVLQQECDAGTSADIRYPPRVIVPEALFGFPRHLQNRSVAVVGNGPIIGRGEEIDAHDEVIRMDTLRNWKRSKGDDGTRISLWAGHPFKHFTVDGEGQPQVSDPFREVVSLKLPLWFISPYHVTVVAYRWLAANGVLDRVTIAPSQYVTLDLLCRHLDATQLSKLFSIPTDKPWLKGLTRFELLLTGPKLALFLYACGARQVSLYGFDFFRSEPARLWKGHDLATDLWLIDALKSGFQARQGSLRWNEEEQVRQTFDAGLFRGEENGKC